MGYLVFQLRKENLERTMSRWDDKNGSWRRKIGILFSWGRFEAQETSNQLIAGHGPGAGEKPFLARIDSMPRCRSFHGATYRADEELSKVLRPLQFRIFHAHEINDPSGIKHMTSCR